jgi:hypothetical protein
MLSTHSQFTSFCAFALADGAAPQVCKPASLARRAIDTGVLCFAAIAQHSTMEIEYVTTNWCLLAFAGSKVTSERDPLAIMTYLVAVKYMFQLQHNIHLKWRMEISSWYFV